MPTALLIALPVALGFIVFACACAWMAPKMHMALRVAGALMFVPVALFCLYGFAASMEPGDFHIVWRIGYVLMLLGSLAAMGRLAFARRIQKPSEQE